MAQSNALTTTTTGSSAPSVIPPTAPTASVKTKAPTKGPVQPQKKPTTVDNGRRAYRNQVVVENVDRQAFRGVSHWILFSKKKDVVYLGYVDLSTFA